MPGGVHRRSWGRAMGALTAVVGVLLLGGCIQPAQTMDTIPTARNLISADMLSGQLGLSLVKRGKYSVSLAGGTNSLLIFGPPRAQALLNGRRIDAAGEIDSTSGQLGVSPELVARIRRNLRRRSSVPAVVRFPSPRLSEYQPSGTPPRQHRRPRRVSATVVIDAGHGGKDPGANRKGLPAEKTIVLDTARRVAQLLEQQGVRVIMTRSDDRFIELARRAEIANKAKADLFVSIHVDAAANRRAQGATMYVAKASSRESRALARRLVGSVKPCVSVSRGVRRKDLRVLVDTDMPAVLVEMGYISHRGEARKLARASHRDRLAKAIAAGVHAHLSAR